MQTRLRNHRLLIIFVAQVCTMVLIGLWHGVAFNFALWGLWLAAAWGGVVWLTAAISMAAVELVFPQIYGGRFLVVFGELATILAYIGLSVMAARERPP